MGIGENAELISDAVTITEFIDNPWEEFSNALCKKEADHKANKKVIDTDKEKIDVSDSEYDDEVDDADNDVLGRDVQENEDDDESYDEEDERIIDQLENNIKGSKGSKGIKEKEFLAEEVRKGEELDDDDIVDCKFDGINI